MSDEKKTPFIRPKDENFDVPEATKNSQDNEAAKDEGPKQNPLVIVAILASGLVIAAVAVFLYQVLKSNQRTVIPTQSVTEFPVQSSETPPESQETSASEEQTSETQTDKPTEPPTESQTSPDDTTYAEYDITIGDITYHIRDGYAIVTKVKIRETIAEIPTEVEGWPVRTIGDGAFNGNTYVKNIRIPNGVTAFGGYAFANMGLIQEIIIPPSVNYFGDHCFDYTSGQIFVVQEGSFAWQAAKAQNIPFRIGDKFSFE
ncbi:MAG: leucine-rich repeat domain-containing protein [Lachnospiraceae bacterium]|nr:leucine-rich repeat domain-containing protein [Lachnospiraceae bacterium]